VSTWTRAAAMTVLASLALAAGQAAAEEPTQAAQEAIDTLRKETPSVKIKINPRTGMPSSVTGLAATRENARSALSASSKEPTEAELKASFEAHFARSALSAAYSGVNPSARVVATTRPVKDRDVPGQYITEGEQRLGDIPVFASKARVVQGRSRSVLSASTNLSRVAIDSTVPAVPQETAIENARARLKEIISRPSAAPQLGPRKIDPASAKATAALQVFDPDLIASRGQISGPTRLAWMVSVAGFRIFVDAKSGEVFYYYRDHPSAGLIRRIFDLADGTEFPGKRVIDEEKHERLDPVHEDADTAFENAGLVLDYFATVLGRKGLDERGLTPQPSSGEAAKSGKATVIESFVRFGDLSNAYWCTQESDYCFKRDIMIYGPGYAGALDIVGHEMTHGIIAYEADLLYADEPGAVNEAMADIFGSLIERHVRGKDGDWKIAANLPGYQEVPLRDMVNPHLAKGGQALFYKDKGYSHDGNRGQPDHWDEFVRRIDPMCADLIAEDNGCVHINSGILNKMATLIATGGTHHGVTVSGIGDDKLARIAYRSLTTHLNTGSGFLDTAAAFVLSCSELAGAAVSGISSADCAQVQAATQAVGLNSES